MHIITYICLSLQTIDVIAKVISIGTSEKVTSKDGKELVRCNSIIADGSAAARLVLWATNITEVECENTYKFNHVRVRQMTDREGHTERFISTTPETTISPHEDIDTSAIDTDIKLPTKTYVTSVCNIEAIDNISKYQKCRQCKTKVNKVSDVLMRCPSCESISLSQNTDHTIAIKMRCATSKNQKLHLTVFGDSLSEIFDENLYFLHEEDLCTHLLQLETVKITYSVESMTVTEITTNPI